ncbi:hypothetical protein GCU56_05285 [Geodermatophilus sabuli]|uniref:Uncharacterized protein n=1 Tax=Geodermatophilus sabuli TaxID=1564158 RepID=A0A7K3VXB0_9ACTN|nr:hypothetical protein [Geodermatophilus sabuli]NEK57286.1 hypothetical protein [Geodermatophilus sabuli]
MTSPFVDVDRTGPLRVAPTGFTRLGAGPRAPFCSLVLDVGHADEGTGIELGLDGPRGGVRARHVPAEGSVTIEVTGAGGPHVVAGTTVPAAPAATIALVLNENQVTVLMGPAEGDLRPVLTERDGVRRRIDLRDPTVLEGLEYGYGATGTGSVELSAVRAGYSGGVGVRDPQVVRRPDGSPLVRDGKLYLTLTNAGLGFFQQAHWGVWTLDLADPRRLTQVAALFSARDGLVLGDHAGQLVVDEVTGRTIVLVSSWGDHDPDTGVHVRHLVTDGVDLLTGVHVLATERLALPTAESAWDPSLVRVGDRWHIAFTECVSFGPPRYVFHPALAVAAPGADYADGLTLVGADSGREQTEGTILERFGRRWYLLASDRDAAEYPVYDLDLRHRGSLRAPYGTNIPHPMVVRAGTHRRAPWWLLTFDGTGWHEDQLGYGTHGDFVVLSTG